MGTITILQETTKNPITLMGVRAGVCWNADIADNEKNYKRGMDCIRSGHGRVMEYVNVEMIIDGYSARVIREWYTHLGGSPTRLQASTRYIDYSNKGFEYITPQSVAQNPEAVKKWDALMDHIRKECADLENNYGVSKEDVANALPLGMTTKIVDKRNLRNLVDMSHQRMCNRAYWEYRELFHDLCAALSAYSEEWKWIVENLFVPKCKFLGHCPETRPCGKNTMKQYAIYRDAEGGQYVKGDIGGGYTINYNDGSHWDYCSKKENDILAKTEDTGEIIKLDHYSRTRIVEKKIDEDVITGAAEKSIFPVFIRPLPYASGNGTKYRCPICKNKLDVTDNHCEKCGYTVAVGKDEKLCYTGLELNDNKLCSVSVDKHEGKDKITIELRVLKKNYLLIRPELDEIIQRNKQSKQSISLCVNGISCSFNPRKMYDHYVLGNYNLFIFSLSYTEHVTLLIRDRGSFEEKITVNDDDLLEMVKKKGILVKVMNPGDDFMTVQRNYMDDLGCVSVRDIHGDITNVYAVYRDFDGSIKYYDYPLLKFGL